MGRSLEMWACKRFENKALSRGSIGKLAPTPAEITIRKNQANGFVGSSKRGKNAIRIGISSIITNTLIIARMTNTFFYLRLLASFIK
jgi:hypothetical protein